MILPAGDLAYQSHVLGHQGAAATYFSVYFIDVDRTCPMKDRKEAIRRDYNKAKELGEKA